MITGEQVARIEHKLDVLITYLKALTGDMPEDMPKQIPGMGGMTTGTCPITNTPIYIRIDPRSGDVRRTDGLKTGLVEVHVNPETNSFVSNSVVLGKSPMGNDNED